MRWWIPVLIVTILAGLVSCGGNKSGSAAYSTITAQQLQGRIESGEKLVIVDLREPQLFRAGHVPGARNIPFEEFRNRINDLNPADEIVLICHDGPMGDISGTLLAQKGYAKVSNVAGGMTAWKGKLEK